MLAKAYAKKLSGGNGYRRFLIFWHLLLWLAVTAVGFFHLVETLKDLGIEAISGVLTAISDAGSALTAPIFEILGGLLPFEGSLEIVMIAVFLLWVLLFWAWVRLFRTRYICCVTNAGTAIYAGKIFQKFVPGTLSVDVDGEALLPYAWFTDEEQSVAAKAKLRVRARSIALFGEIALPEPIVEESVAEEEPAVIEEAPAEPVEPEIRVIIREALEREAAAASAPVAPVAPAPAPTPASAPAPAPVVTEAPAATEDGDDEDEELGEVREVTVDGKTFRMVIRYSRSFTARVIQAPDFLKNYYSEIKNELMSYALVKSRISWKHDAFNRGRLQLAKLVVRGKSLCLYLALDPAAYEVEKYHQIDQSGKNAYAKVPMMVRIKSDLGLRKAKFLISEMMANYDIERGEVEDLDYASWYAYKDTKTLIEEKLIKELETPEEE